MLFWPLDHLKPFFFFFKISGPAPVNRNVVSTIRHNRYKNVLLNNKCVRHSLNRIQSKAHLIGTYEINKISLSSFDDKIYIIYS